MHASGHEQARADDHLSNRRLHMEGFDHGSTFGYEESKDYDALGTRADEEVAVEFHTRWSAAALGVAVGTGRIALLLTKAGMRLDGIGLSRDVPEQFTGPSRRQSRVYERIL
jgi:hypothetical protein